ncbi:hypothetical protein Ae201684_006758 [Aphanomyces euteiches]|uniref:Uncharacterized protein n=1 Tax=Aphanomyces euteiches TaxID=100861 RepID=A0A6G0XA68_9STRA|nr:hypothetical protein Ae201684_006758 [Aphanomyces euteiches]
MASPTRFASTIPPLEKRHSFAKSANEGLSMVVLVPYQLGVHRRHVKAAWHQLKNQRRLSFNRKENGFKSIAERRNESELTSMQRWRSLIKSFKASSNVARAVQDSSESAQAEHRALAAQVSALHQLIQALQASATIDVVTMQISPDRSFPTWSHAKLLSEHSMQLTTKESSAPSSKVPTSSPSVQTLL